MTAIYTTSHLRTFAMASLMSSKMLLRRNLGSDSRFHALTGTARSVPSRGRSWSLFKICIAQRCVCCLMQILANSELGCPHNAYTFL